MSFHNDIEVPLLGWVGAFLALYRSIDFGHVAEAVLITIITVTTSFVLNLIYRKLYHLYQDGKNAKRPPDGPDS